MELVSIPGMGIVVDVIAESIAIDFISDDMFVIVALPNGKSRGLTQAVNATRDGRFETGYERRERFWFHKKLP